MAYWYNHVTFHDLTDYYYFYSKCPLWGNLHTLFWIFHITVRRYWSAKKTNDDLLIKLDDLSWHSIDIKIKIFIPIPKANFTEAILTALKYAKLVIVIAFLFKDLNLSEWGWFRGWHECRYMTKKWIFDNSYVWNKQKGW